MDLHLDLDGLARHAAAQITAGLRDAVRSGRLAAGTRLPPSRALAADIGVSRGPVVEAYEQLAAEGLLVSRQGAGTWVAGLSRRPARSSGPAADPATAPAQARYDLTPGTPDLAGFPRQQWLAALRHAAAVLPHHQLGYADPAGLPELRAELAGYLRRVRAADASAGDVIVVAGVAQGPSPCRCGSTARAWTWRPCAAPRPARCCSPRPTSTRPARCCPRAAGRRLPAGPPRPTPSSSKTTTMRSSATTGSRWAACRAWPPSGPCSSARSASRSPPGCGSDGWPRRPGWRTPCGSAAPTPTSGRRCWTRPRSHSSSRPAPTTTTCGGCGAATGPAGTSW